MSMKGSFWTRTLAAVALAGWTGAAAAARVGKPAPDFTVTDVNGKAVHLAALQGHYVVLEWHNKDCPFVHKFYDGGAMQALQAKWTAKGVTWLSIVSSGEGAKGCVTPEGAHADLAATKAVPTTMILDTTQSIARAYGAKTTPHMFVINPKGVLIYDGAIDDHATADASDIPGAKNYVDAALTEAMAGKPVTVSSTRPYGCGVKYKKG